MAFLHDPHYQAMDANGDPLSGAKLYFFQVGTTTAITTYQDAALSTPHASPVVADSSGRFAPVYVNTSPYKTRLDTSADVVVQTVETVYGGADGILTKGSSVATASTIDLDAATGPNIDLTGTTTVSAVTLSEGRIRLARAVAAFTLTASSTLVVNGSSSVDYTTIADDLLVFEGYAAGVVRVWKVYSAALIDDDTFATATASNPPSSESTKAYVDTTVAAHRPRLVSTSTPSAVTGVNLTDLPDSWMIEANLGSSAADEVLLLTASYDTGGSPTFQTSYKYAATEITSGGTQTQVNSASATSIIVSRQNDSGSNDRRQLRIWSIPAPSNGSPMVSFEGCSLDSSNVLRHYQGSGIVFAGTGAIRAIRLAQGTGNIDGEINVYAMS